MTPILAHTPATLPAPDPLPVQPRPVLLFLLFLLFPQHPGAVGGKKRDEPVTQTQNSQLTDFIPNTHTYMHACIHACVHACRVHSLSCLCSFLNQYDSSSSASSFELTVPQQGEDHELWGMLWDLNPGTASHLFNLFNLRRLIQLLQTHLQSSWVKAYSIHPTGG